MYIQNNLIQILKKNPLVHIVHCVDAEGPFTESSKDTLKRINSIFKTNFHTLNEILKKISNPSFSKKKYLAIKKLFNPEYLNYNNSWKKLNKMLNEILCKKFRNKVTDDFKNGWTYSWHCVDHLNFSNHNPRKKVRGYGKIFSFYKKKLNNNKSKKDEINWHFHPSSFERNSIASSSTYGHSINILNYILSRRIIDDKWFPVVNRPGFHIERADSHLFLEQWIPFDYANQRSNEKNDQPDYEKSRFGDWSRAPKTWRGYNPSFDDYQAVGYCKRKIFRILNIGTRFNNIKQKHVLEAFEEAKKKGKSILAVTNHDYRHMKKSIDDFRNILQKVRNKFIKVKIKFSGAEEAAKDLCSTERKFKMKAKLKKNQLLVKMLRGKIFGAQPFLAIKTKKNQYFHENFDVLKKGKVWSYFFDYNTMELSKVDKIGIGSAGKYGSFQTIVINCKK